MLYHPNNLTRRGCSALSAALGGLENALGRVKIHSWAEHAAPAVGEATLHEEVAFPENMDPN